MTPHSLPLNSGESEIFWYDWRGLEQYAEIYRFTRLVIALRQAHPIFRRTTFFTGHEVAGDQYPDIHWYGRSGRPAAWDPTDKRLMCTLDGSKKETGAAEDDLDVVLMFNADDQDALFYLPGPPHYGRWRLAIDTSLPSPHDIHPSGAEMELEPAIAYHVRARSLVVLWAEPVRIRRGEATRKHARRSAKRTYGP